MASDQDSAFIFSAIRRGQIENLRTLSSSDVPLMDLSAIQAATNNFSKENKLGEGGFGPVYRVTTLLFSQGSFRFILLGRPSTVLL